MDNVKLETSLSVVKRDAGGVIYKECLYQLPIVLRKILISLRIII